MSSWRYASPADPDAELEYDLRADSRLRAAFRAQQLANFAESYVHLYGDDIDQGLSMLPGIASMAELLKQLEHDVVMHALAAGASWAQVGDGLGISAESVEHRFGDRWSEHQELHAADDDRQPIPEQMRRLMRGVATLDAWCQQRQPENGPDQVSGYLIWPTEPGQPVRTRTAVEEDARRAAQEAETRAMVAAYIAERDARVAAALKRLSGKPGLAHSPVWPESGTTEHVATRDGQYLGRIRKLSQATVLWQLEDGPALATADKQQKYTSLKAAVAALDRLTPPEPAPADANS